MSTLSQKSATVAEFRRCLAVFGDSVECGQGLDDDNLEKLLRLCDYSVMLMMQLLPIADHAADYVGIGLLW